MSQPIVIERTHLLTTIGLLHDTPSLLVPPYYELQTGVDERVFLEFLHHVANRWHNVPLEHSMWFLAEEFRIELLSEECGQYILQCRMTIENPGPLTLRFFNVGQASFTLISCGTAALAIDCGSDRSHTVWFWTQSDYTEELFNAFRHVTRLGVLATHIHEDHTNEIFNLLSFVTELNNHRSRNRTNGSDLPNIETVPWMGEENYCKAWTHSRNDVANYLFQVFEGTPLEGGIGRILCLRPQWFEGTSLENIEGLPSADPDHDYNAVLFIEYCGAGVIIPGDANSNVYGYLLSQYPGMAGLLARTDLLLAPHHGSLRNG
jgi:hypothetical protein